MTNAVKWVEASNRGSPMTSHANLEPDTLAPAMSNRSPLNYIQHPANIPLILTPASADALPQPPLPLGLICNSSQAFTTNSSVQISCPQLSSDIQCQGRIVWCRRQASGYQVAVAFFTPDELYRIRMLEQLCHIDHYRRDCKAQGAPLSRETAALEWIDKFAAHFPSDGL